MKIALINYEYPPIGGGAATATQSMGRALVQMGHEVVVVTAAFGDLRGSMTDHGVEIIRLPVPRDRADASGVFEMAAFLATASLVYPFISRRKAIDGTIAFFTIPSGPAAWLDYLLGGAPYIVSLRGGDVPGFVPEVGMFHTLVKPLRRAVLRGALAVIANSNGLRDLSLAADPVPVEVIPNGVDTEFFKPDASPLGGPFRVVVSGRFHSQKNHVLALRAFASLANQQRVAAELHLIGDGPLRSELEVLARELRIEQDVRWHGWLPRHEVAALLRSSHCLLHTALYEGMPNAVLEAMACGLPIVASDIPGSCDVVRHERNGWLLPLDNAEGFAKCLALLAGNDTMRQDMGRQSRIIAETEFSWAATASRYVEVLRRSIHASA